MYDTFFSDCVWIGVCLTVMCEPKWLLEGYRKCKMNMGDERRSIVTVQVLETPVSVAFGCEQARCRSSIHLDRSESLFDNLATMASNAINDLDLKKKAFKETQLFQKKKLMQTL